GMLQLIQGPGSSARLLRLPGRALGPSAHVKPRSRAYLRRCIIESCGPRELCRPRPQSSWCSNSSTPPQKHGGDLKGENQLPKVVQGVKFQNGIEVIELSAHHAA